MAYAVKLTLLLILLVGDAHTLLYGHHYYLPIMTIQTHQTSSPAPNKRGFACTYCGQMTPDDVSSLSISWYHNWSMSQNDHAAEFVPHFWCDIWQDGDSDNFVDYIAEVSMLPSDYDGYMLFLNEPDLAAPQCNITPAYGAQLYNWVKATIPNVKLIGVQVSHGDGIRGFKWLREWRNEVLNTSGAYPDMWRYTIHEYNDDPRPQVEALLSLQAEWGIDTPLWVTEFGTCKPDVMRDMVQYYEGHDMIERYAVYAPLLLDCQALIDWNTRELTAVGEGFTN